MKINIEGEIEDLTPDDENHEEYQLKMQDTYFNVKVKIKKLNLHSKRKKKANAFINNSIRNEHNLTRVELPKLFMTLE